MVRRNTREGERKAIKTWWTFKVEEGACWKVSAVELVKRYLMVNLFMHSLRL